MTRLHYFLVFTAFFGSCKGSDPFTKDKVSKISYEFFDSSVPPEYHRSYEISVNSDEVHLVVDTYGDILVDEVYPLSANQFDQLLVLINEARIRKCAIPDSEPCSGGTAEKLTIDEGSKKTELYLDHCGDVQEYPEGCGDVRAIIDLIKSFVPDLSEKLQ